MSNAQPGVLYLSYEGMLEPLGQSQVAAYLKCLAEDHRVHLISFEKPRDLENKAELDRVRHELAEANVSWKYLTYHKTPTLPATAFDVASGIALGARLIKEHDLRIVHARSYVPSVMAIALKRMLGIQYVFDMRGLWVDERVDGGLWPRGGPLHRGAKKFEETFLEQTDHLVSLTQAGITRLESMLPDGLPPYSVIPTCADLDHFSLKRTKARDTFRVAYVGSTGTWYNFEAVARTMASILRRRPNAELLVLNKGQHEYIRQTLRDASVPDEVVTLKSVRHRDVPAELATVDLGVFYYRPSFSRAACSPTKLGEFLGCGIPCLTNSGVGDMADILRADSAGVAVDDFDDASLEAGVDAVLRLLDEEDIAERCRASAERWFSLEVGVRGYAEIYRRLAQPSV